MPERQAQAQALALAPVLWQRVPVTVTPPQVRSRARVSPLLVR